MLGIISIILFMKQYSVNTKSALTEFSSYYFQEKGSFYLNFSDISADKIFIGICSSTEYNNLQKVESLNEQLCNSKVPLINKSTLISTQNMQNIQYEGTVSSKGKYIPVVYSCDQTYSDFSLKLIFSNPHSKLSYNFQPFLYIKPIVTAIILSGIIFWIYHWIKNFSFNNILHNVITLVIGYFFLYEFIFILQIFVEHMSDTTSSIKNIRIVIRFPYEILLVTLLQYVSKGLGIIHYHFFIKDIIVNVIISLLIVTPLIIIDEFDISEQLNFIILAFGLFFIAIFYKILFTDLSKSATSFIGHLIMISRSNINVVTTPIYPNYQFYNLLSFIFPIYFVVYLFQLFFRSIIDINEWIIRLIKDVSDLVIVGLMIWKFKMTKSNKFGYGWIGSNDNNENKTYLTQIEIDAVNDDDELLYCGTNDWNEGMKLPNPPLIV